MIVKINRPWQGYHGMNRFLLHIVRLFSFLIFDMFRSIIWVKVFKNGPSKTCGRQPLKNLK